MPDYNRSEKGWPDQINGEDLAPPLCIPIDPRFLPSMPEHRIRLRGAWELLAQGGWDAPITRRSLPTTWPVDLAGPIRLIRRFGMPPIDPASEALSLEFLAVPGLVRIDLNGVELPFPPAGSVDWVVRSVGPLLARNTLTLDVELGRTDRPEKAEGWGTIALVITPKIESEV
jgi:hypothetical protein